MSDELNVVKEEPTTPQPSEGKEPGSKTDSALLLESLKEERERRRLAEDKAKILEEQIETLTASGDPSDEDLKKVKSDLAGIKQKLAKDEIISSNPVFKDKWNEFEKFREEPENKGMNMTTAAKAFLAENGLVSPRKGLEKTTGGPSVPQPVGMTVDEVKNLRMNNHKKYLELLQAGKIEIR